MNQPSKQSQKLYENLRKNRKVYFYFLILKTFFKTKK